MELSPIDRPPDSTVAWDAKTAPKAAPKAHYWHRIDRLQIGNRVILPYSTDGAKSCCVSSFSTVSKILDIVEAAHLKKGKGALLGEKLVLVKLYK
uniref:Uncharacterized protein n=1 Tax=Chromera velia CCMP2878 TaxID=1169474 RepID=A0A0G4HA26_9ALVE|eukprot:Cvel_25416.t1-p1 / transcript=Cvel_25416.t1 / gene=Cvel_25416 / organism=Chromera_velia_CCMP2878 / gene_product=hypothetical protein / transcript_product=hypothetical protein / location=Cvel_scaffold2877:6521-9278(-) / protein_length=94 / sequence_SO=supercontig / SO=protein_coding / is_pseudo=false